MNTAPMIRKYRETLIPGIISMLLMSGLLALLIITGYLFAANPDDRIAAAAREAFVSQAYLKGDDIQVHSAGWRGHACWGPSPRNPIYCWPPLRSPICPGVKRVDNRLEVRARASAGQAPGSAQRTVSRPDFPAVSK